MESTADAKATVWIDAIVYPACECGEPWVKHGVCGGYKPSRPIENHGTVFFKSNDRLANGLFRIERALQRLRAARLRRK